MEAEPVFELRFDCRGYCLAASASPRKSLITEVVYIGVLQADPGGEGCLLKGLKQSINVGTYGPRDLLAGLEAGGWG